MLSSNQIKTLSLKLQTTEQNVRREYFQHLFLSYFYGQKTSDSFYFKGGTALRLLYGSPRFSEDLDFSSETTHIRSIEDLILLTISEIEKGGVTLTVKESKATTGGYLALFSSEIFGEPVPIQLQISFREKSLKGGVISVASEYLPIYSVVSLMQEQLIGEKIKALLSRKKPRDFYDLYFILRANLFRLEQKSFLQDALEVIENVDINFEGELKQFLPKSHWLIIKDFKNILTNEVQRFI